MLTLRHYPAALAAITGSMLLLTFAAASSPFVVTAAGSVALQRRLALQTPLATGLEIIQSSGAADNPAVVTALRRLDTSQGAAARLARQLGHARAPLVTVTAQSNGFVTVPRRGALAVQLMSRTAVTSHVPILSKAAGLGVWIADVVATPLGVRPGAKIRVGIVGSSATVAVRVKGIYQDLAQIPPSPYWANFTSSIYPLDPTQAAPPTFLFAGRAELLRILHGLGAAAFTTDTYELAVDPRHLSLSQARQLGHRFDTIRALLESGAVAPVARQLGCAQPYGSCTVDTQLFAAVKAADAQASAASPIVSLFSAIAAVLSLAAVAAAGVLTIRRRRGEAAARFARGESPPRFATRIGREILVPALVAGAVGVVIALALTDVFAPKGTVDRNALDTGIEHAAIALAAGVCVTAIAGGLAFARQFDSAARRQPAPRWLLWELPLVAAGIIYLLVEVGANGGLARSGSSGTYHPTLALFVAPLALIAGISGLAARGLRYLLRRVSGPRVRVLPSAVYMAIRRLATARRSLLVLAVTSAVSIGALAYARMLNVSLRHAVNVKAYSVWGTDVQGEIGDQQRLPRRFPYPLTRVEIGFGETHTSKVVDVAAVDPTTLAAALHWDGDWSKPPSQLLAALARAPSTPLPVVVTPNLAHATTLNFNRTVPIRVLGTIRAFPALDGPREAITSLQALAHAARASGFLFDHYTYVWAKGPPRQVTRALAATSLHPFPVTTVTSFFESPDVQLITRTYRYMSTIAAITVILALIATMLYLQARQRSQIIASALAHRMGLSRRAETASLFLEIATITTFAALIGLAVATATAAPIAHRIDPLPIWPPPPTLITPTPTTIAAFEAALLLVSLLIAVGVSWAANRADAAAELRAA